MKAKIFSFCLKAYFSLIVWWRSLFLALITLLLILGSHFLDLESKAQMMLTIYPPLATRGAEIIDARRQAVLLRGVNWFGIETDLHVPHGLWLRDYADILAQIKSLGYNLIRLPYSLESLQANSISGVDFTIGKNHKLEGKTPLEVMDIIIQEAQRQGLMILLDSHRLNSQRIPELWYGDGYTEADWINTWTMLARRYRHQTNVIGADLKNEPHGIASWGTNDLKTDWRLAAIKAGNAILAINPDWLIVVEGVENNVPNQKLQHWMGGNLEGVKNYPVKLSLPNRLVYSPHEYGSGVFPQPWFNEPNFPRNLSQRWQIGFHYIASQKIAPILIGEFGGRQVDTISKEGIWQRNLVDFIARNRLHYSYWSWNPNSIDTGGILADDWQTVNPDKQQLLNQILPNGSLIATEPSVNIPETISQSNQGSNLPASSPTNQNTIPLEVTSKIQSDWQTGFCVNIRVTNLSQTSISNWQLSFRMNQAKINHSWNGSFRNNNSQYTVTPPDWAKIIEPNQSRELGFCANKLGWDYKPRQFSVSSS